MLITEHSRCQPGAPTPHGDVPLEQALAAVGERAPEREVGLVALPLDGLDPGAFEHAREVEPGQRAVVVLGRGCRSRARPGAGTRSALSSRTWAKLIICGTYSVARGQWSGKVTLRARRSSQYASVYPRVISSTERPSAREASSTLSSPWSASFTRCPTSVMLMTWWTVMPAPAAPFASACRRTRTDACCPGAGRSRRSGRTSTTPTAPGWSVTRRSSRRPIEFSTRSIGTTRTPSSRRDAGPRRRSRSGRATPRPPASGRGRSAGCRPRPRPNARPRSTRARSAVPPASPTGSTQPAPTEPDTLSSTARRPGSASHSRAASRSSGPTRGEVGILVERSDRSPRSRDQNRPVPNPTAHTAPAARQ